MNLSSDFIDDNIDDIFDAVEQAIKDEAITRQETQRMTTREIFEWLKINNYL